MHNTLLRGPVEPEEMPSMPNQRRGGVLRPLLKGTKWAAKQLLANVTRDFDFRHQSAEGILDMTARRYMLDYGNFARLYADGQEWHGRSGRAIATLPVRYRHRCGYWIS